MNYTLVPPRRWLLDQTMTVIAAAVGIRMTEQQAEALLELVGFVDGGKIKVEVSAIPAKGTRDWILRGFLCHVMDRPTGLAPFDVSTWCEFKIKAQAKGFQFATLRGEPVYLVTATALSPRLREGPEAWPDMLKVVRAELRSAIPDSIH